MKEDELFRIYDRVISFLIDDIMERSTQYRIIGLDKFNPNSREHLVIFNAAYIAAGLLNKKVAVNLPWLQYIKFRIDNWQLRQGFINKGIKSVPVSKTIGKLVNEFPDANQLERGIGDIYDAYYKPRKDNE